MRKRRIEEDTDSGREPLVVVTSAANVAIRRITPEG